MYMFNKLFYSCCKLITVSIFVLIIYSEIAPQL